MILYVCVCLCACVSNYNAYLICLGDQLEILCGFLLLCWLATIGVENEGQTTVGLSDILCACCAGQAEDGVEADVLLLRGHFGLGSVCVCVSV